MLRENVYNEWRLQIQPVLSLTWSSMCPAEPEAEVVAEGRGGLDQAGAPGALPNSCVWK